jgi:hypothetical protein
MGMAEQSVKQELETKVEKILADMDLRFTSGNSVPVERAHIHADDYMTLKTYIASLRNNQK